MSKVLILKTVSPNMTSYGGFKWPKSGLVEALDWRDVWDGLQGALWGEGDGTFFNWGPDAKWIVFEADEADVRVFDGRVKVPRGVVVYCGGREGATAYLAERAPGRAIIGAAVTSHDIATAGYEGTATAGDHGTATVGSYGTAKAGDFGIATAGYCGTAVAGFRGTATASNFGTAIVGHCGIASVGLGGAASAGIAGEIQIRWWGGSRLRLAVGYVGEKGIKPHTLFRCNDKGEFIKDTTQLQAGSGADG